MGNDPVDGRDPTGLYNCAEKDCKVIEGYVHELRRAANTPTTGSLAADPALKAVARTVGSMNDGNKVDISLAKINGVADGNTVLNNGRADITLDPSKITNNQYGAGVLGHEATHGLQFLIKGQENSLQDIDNRERQAYRVQSYLNQRLGVETEVWWRGVTDQQRSAAIRNGANGSCVAASIGSSPLWREPFPGTHCP